MHRYQRWNAYAFRVQLAHAMTWGLRRDHGDIHVGRGGDLPEVDVESMREHERLAGRHVRRDLGVVEIALDVIGNQDHDHLGRFGCVGGGHDFQSGGFRLGPGLAARVEPDHYVDARIAQVERVRMTLAAVADDRYWLA